MDMLIDPHLHASITMSAEYNLFIASILQVDDENFGANLVKINDKKDLESLIASGNKASSRVDFATQKPYSNFAEGCQ